MYSLSFHRREYLNLDKWLTDQMRECGEPFVKAVVQNLQRKLPAIMGGPNGPLKEEHLTKANFPFESLPVVLFSLQATVQANMPMAPEVKETIMTMIENSKRLIMQISQRGPPQQQQQPPSVNQPAVSAAPGPPGGLPPPPPGVLRPAGFGGGGGTANTVPVRPTPRNPSGGPPNLPPVGGPLPPPLPPATAGGSSLFPGGAGGAPADMAGLASQFGSSLSFGGSQPGNAPGLPPSSSSAFTLPNALGPLISAGGGGGGGGAGTGGGSAAASAGAGGNAPNAAGSEPSGMEVIRAGISNIGNLFPGSNGSKEVEDEANSYFQRIYNHPPNPTLTIDEVLDLLKRFATRLDFRLKLL